MNIKEVRLSKSDAAYGPFTVKIGDKVRVQGTPPMIGTVRDGTCVGGPGAYTLTYDVELVGSGAFVTLNDLDLEKI